MIRACYKGGPTSARAPIVPLLTLICGTVLAAQSATPASLQNHYDSDRVRQILQEARANQAADTKRRMAFEELGRREVKTFSDFDKQCSDLQVQLDEASAIEKRKKRLLTELEQQFQSHPDYPKIRRFFETLRQMEDETDKAEPIWRGMIACSRILEASTPSAQAAHEGICIDPANKQLSLLQPKMEKSMTDLQEELKAYGETLPPDVLKLMSQ